MATLPRVTPRQVWKGNPATPGYEPDKDDIVRLTEEIQATQTIEPFANIVGALGDLPSSGNTTGDKSFVYDAPADGGGLYNWSGSAWVKIGEIPAIFWDDSIATAAQAASVLAAASASDAADSATDAAASAVESAAHANDAELAALAAGAPIVTTLTSPTPSNGTVELLKVDAGLRVYLVVGGAWVDQGWLVGPTFDTVATMLADTSTSLGSTGDYVTGGGFQYTVVSSGEDLVTAGGVKLLLSSAYAAINVRAFGATGDGSTDDTDALQAAVNRASKSNVMTLYFPAGIYVYDALYLFYHLTLNPGFDQSADPLRHGKFAFEGDGAVDISNLRTYNPGYGSVLEATGDGLVVARSSLGHDSNPYPARAFSATNMTFVANKSGQYAIESACCPMFRMKNCTVRQRNTGGHGILAASSWFVELDNVKVIGVAGSTGRGVTTGTTIFAGLWVMKGSSLIDSFRDGWVWTGGSFENVAFRDTAIQNCTRDSIRAEAGALHLFQCQNVYFEGADGVFREHDIRGIGAVIRSLDVDGMFVLGSLAGGSQDWITDCCIFLDQTNSVNIQNVDYNRYTKPFMRVTSIENGGASSGFVSDFRARKDFADPASTVFMFEGILPNFGEGVVYPGYNAPLADATQKTRLFDTATAYPFEMHHFDLGTTSILAPAFGPTFYGNTASTAVYPACIVNSLYDYTVTGADVACYLPAATVTPAGRRVAIRNNVASGFVLAVRQEATDGELIAWLQPGASVTVFYDPENTKWLAESFSVAQQVQITRLTDSTGGTANNTVSPITAASFTTVTGTSADAAINANFTATNGNVTTLNNNFADLAAKVNAILAAMEDSALVKPSGA